MDGCFSCCSDTRNANAEHAHYGCERQGIIRGSCFIVAHNHLRVDKWETVWLNAHDAKWAAEVK